MPRQGVTVAGPRSLPFGTRVRIEGVGERVVQDRLPRRYEGRFDVFFNSHETAREFGKQTLKVTIIR
jgi:3D (Asp-Asp-Asp) domain-containing protein